jgi:hypothetical protein
MALAGRTEISCAVSALGTLENCRIVSEVPAGIGFGAASLSMAALFHMRPKTVDGAPVAGGEVRIPLQFALPPTPVPPAAGATQPPVSAAALALARRLIAADGDAQGASQGIVFGVKQLLDRLQQDPSAGGDTEEAQTAIAAIEKAYQDTLPTILDRQARAVASKLSSADLAAAVAFMESPAGKAWVAQRTQGSSERQAEGQETWNIVRDAAKKIFCLQVACPPSNSAQPGPGEPPAAGAKSAPSAGAHP